MSWWAGSWSSQYIEMSSLMPGWSALMLVFPWFGHRIFVDMLIIIILMASQRNHPFSLEKWDVLRKHLVLKPSLFSGPSFFFNRSEMPFENKCTASYPAFKDYDGDGEKKWLLSWVFPIWLLPDFKILFPFLFSFLSRHWQILERNTERPIFSATLGILTGNGWPYFLGLVLGVDVADWGIYRQ